MFKIRVVTEFANNFHLLFLITTSNLFLLSVVVSTVVSQVLFGPFRTVEHIPTKSSLSIKKVPVEKESSHSKFFGQLCNSST